MDRPMPGITNFYDYHINTTTPHNELATHAFKPLEVHSAPKQPDIKFMLALAIVGVGIYLSTMR